MEIQPPSNPNSRREKHRRALASVARWGIPNESACHEAPVPTKPLLTETPTEGSYYEFIVDAETGDLSVIKHMVKE
jgi:hypothetical protein